jgi:MerR family transcriptional regulator, redox-sensitive transcriptional activator SoxR
MDATLTIGEVARRAGLNTSAIRYYESRGVLPTPDRESGRRRYTEETVQRLHVIDVAKRAGFSLDEAAVLLATADQGEPVSEPLRQLAMRKLPDVEALIVRAEAMRDWLRTATACNCKTLDVCALFDDQPAAEPPSEAATLRITHVTARSFRSRRR